MLSKKENIDKLIYYSFLALIAWLPLPFGSNRPWAEAIMEVWVFSLTLVWILGFICGKFQMTTVLGKALPVLFLFLFWLIWILVQTIPLPSTWILSISPSAFESYDLVRAGDIIAISLDPHSTIVAWLKSLAYILIFLLALLLINTHHRLKQLANIIIYSGLFQAVYGSLMTLTGIGYGFFIQNPHALQVTTGTFINRNHMAGYLVMSLSVGIGMMIARLDKNNNFTRKQRIRNYLRLVLSSKLRLRLYLVIMVIALVLTHSRMGNTSFFIALILAGTIGLILSKHATRGTIILLSSMIIIDIFIVGTWFGLEKVADRIEQTTLQSEMRDDVDIYTLEQLEKFRWTGSGLGSFYSTFTQYINNDVRGYYDHAHNDYLEFAADSGVIGLGLLGLIVIISVYVALVVQYKRRDPLMRGVSFAAIMSIIAMLIHATVDFNLQVPANAATFMLILAFAWISYGLKDKNYKKGDRLKEIYTTKTHIDSV